MSLTDSHRPTRPDRAERATRTADLLARASRETSPARRRRLIASVVEANMGVADAIASHYRRRGIPDDDLQQVAYLALTKAARRFDPEAGHDFLSYAVPTIRGELRRYFRDNGWMVRPPRKVQELQGRVFAAEAELAAALGRSPSVSEVAHHLDAPLRDVEEALSAEGCFVPTSLDKSVGGESTTTIGDLLGGPDTDTEAVEARVVLAPVVRRLSERDRKVLRLRFYDDCTQREIADAIGVTQTQVSRVLTRIMRELRENVEDPTGHGARLGA
jgi:RNA polymerase sigma-B factor